MSELQSTFAERLANAVKTVEFYDPAKRPIGSNADEWLVFIEAHHNSKEYLAVQIAEALDIAESRYLSAVKGRKEFREAYRTERYRRVPSYRFFQRDNVGDMILASYHNPASITWRWLLAWCRYRPGVPQKWGFSLEPKPRIQGQWRIGFGPFGYLYFASQDPMWRC